MRVPVKFISFSCFLFSVTVVQGQEVTCELKSTTFGAKKIKPEGKTIFRAGESVEITCTEKHRFFQRKENIKSFTCGENGQWDYEPVCEDIRCEVPRDQHVSSPELFFSGDLKLGVKRSYYCMSGYDKKSEKATCTRDGWTPKPLCADIRCEVPHDQYLYSPEYWFSGDEKLGVKRSYYCMPGYDKMSSEATCTRDGWTPKPLCAEITCTAPDILNGTVVEKMQEYQKDAILKYRCSPGFKPREGIPKCAKFGWTLNPECEEVTCELKSTTFGVNKIKPEGKTIFRAGESVEITCTEEHWFYGTNENIKSFTCGENGQWDYEPVCAEIRCEVPYDHPGVYSPGYYFSGDKKLGAKRYYSCMSGYDQMSSQATCTRDGWTPKPLCAINMCAAPNIPNAEIVGYQRTKYTINSRIQYKCNPGFEPEQPVHITCNSQTEWTGIRQCTEKQKSCRDLSVENGLIYSHPSNEEEIFYTCNTGYKPFTGNWWDSATCSKGSWTEEPRCIPEEECGAFPSVHHGKLKQNRHDRETVEVECDPGFKTTQRFITCVRGTWEKPVCEVGVSCNIPPKVEYAFITSKPEELYVDGSSVTYICQSSFLMNGKNTVFCRNGIWEETPKCEEATCPLNTPMEDLKIERFPDIEGSVKPGHKLIFSCNGQGLILKGQTEITCQSNGEWSSPFPKCEEVICVANLPVKMRSDVTEDGHPGPEVSVRPGYTITLSCVGKGTELLGQSKITCLSTGEWNAPFPKCVGGKCERPPLVDAADTKEMTKTEYNSGERVEYICFTKYTLDLRHPYSKYLTCEQGEWRGNIKCLKPCSVTVEEMDKRGIELKWAGREKIFSPHQDRITFACQRGKYLIGSNSNLIQYCNDGVISLPECV